MNDIRIAHCRLRNFSNISYFWDMLKTDDLDLYYHIDLKDSRKLAPWGTEWLIEHHKPYCTIAYRIYDSGKHLEYAVTFCNPRESFDKKIGARNATERLQNNETRQTLEFSDAFNNYWSFQEPIRKILKFVPTGINFKGFKPRFLELLLFRHVYMMRFTPDRLKTPGAIVVSRQYALKNKRNRDNFLHLFNRNNFNLGWYSGYRFKTVNGITIAYEFVRDNEIYISVSVCHKGDQFCKKIGRGIAKERLVNLFENGETRDWKQHIINTHWYDKNIFFSERCELEEMFGENREIPLTCLQNRYIREIVENKILDIMA